MNIQHFTPMRHPVI